jgi:uncharacterized protein (DUF2236 family)
MPGYFAKSSMARRALGQRAVALTYGQRALTMGALNSVAAQGTVQSSTHRETPYTRLALTARLFETVFLGSKEEADRALAFTAKRHAHVKGLIEEYGGPGHPAGTPYDAYDPALMWWTAAATLDSVEVQYDNLVGRLRDHEREELFADFVTWAELFGMPRSAAPSDYADFRQSFDAFVSSDQAHLTEETRLFGQYVSGYLVPNPPPLAVRPLFATLHTLVVGSLTPHVRELFDMEWSSLDAARFMSLARSSRLAHGRLPFFASSPLMRGRSEEFYKFIARGERELLRRGGTSMPGVSDVSATRARSRRASSQAAGCAQAGSCCP